MFLIFYLHFDAVIKFTITFKEVSLSNSSDENKGENDNERIDIIYNLIAYFEMGTSNVIIQHESKKECCRFVDLHKKNFEVSNVEFL